MRNKRQASFYAESSDLDKFQELFPNCFTLFMQRVLKAVLRDRELFNKIFWSEV